LTMGDCGAALHVGHDSRDAAKVLPQVSEKDAKS
jgi:hypothetical protein